MAVKRTFRQKIARALRFFKRDLLTEVELPLTRDEIIATRLLLNRFNAERYSDIRPIEIKLRAYVLGDTAKVVLSDRQLNELCNFLLLFRADHDTQMSPILHKLQKQLKGDG